MKLTKDQRLQIYNKYGCRCAYCGKEIKYEDMQVDHIKPVFHNWTEEEKQKWLPEGYLGEDTIENMNPSCRMCNFRKGSSQIEDFRTAIEKGLTQLEKIFMYRLLKSYGLIIENKQPVKFYFEKYDEGITNT